MTEKECCELAKQIAKEEKKILENVNNKSAREEAEQRISELILSAENLSLQDIPIKALVK